jgi:broad-specificity NMP kinase
MMSEDRTQTLPNDEFRQILAQLTSINSQLDRVDSRLERLEARDYDTKPIWENALKEIADTRVEMREGFEKMRAEIDVGLRKVAKQIDVMNRSILEVRADLRFMDDRVTKLEPQTAR